MSEIERQLHFTMLNDNIIDDDRVGKNELLVYMALCRYSGRERTAFPGIRTLAEKARLSPNTVQTALKTLQNLGYLLIETRTRGDTQAKTSNLYTLVENGVYQPLTIGVSATDTPPVSATDTEVYTPSEEDSEKKRLEKGGGVVDENSSRDADTPGSAPPPVVDDDEDWPIEEDTSSTPDEPDDDGWPLIYDDEEESPEVDPRESAQEVGEKKESAAKNNASFTDLLGDMYDIAKTYHSRPPRPTDEEKENLHEVATLYGAHIILTAWTDYQKDKPGKPVKWFLDDTNLKAYVPKIPTAPTCKKHGRVMAGSVCVECEHEKRKKSEQLFSTGAKCSVCHKPIPGVPLDGKCVMCTVNEKMKAKQTPATGKPDLQLVKAG